MRWEQPKTLAEGAATRGITHIESLISDILPECPNRSGPFWWSFRRYYCYFGLGIENMIYFGRLCLSFWQSYIPSLAMLGLVLSW